MKKANNETNYQDYTIEKEIAASKRPEKKHSFTRGMLGGICGGVFSMAVVAGLAFNVPQSPLSQGQATTVNAQNQLIEYEDQLVNTVDQVKDAVVSVNNYQRVQLQGHPVFDSFGNFGETGIDLQEKDDDLQLAGTGSGVVYKIEGDHAYLVSNNHVVEGADSLEVVMADGQTVKAELVGRDELSDLAVLKIPKKYATKTVEFANSDDVKVGSIAIAIGSPLGEQFASSVTQGIISGKDRLVEVDTNQDGRVDWEMNVMQTDAAINPGNSGGALVNIHGQLIGINSSKYASEVLEGMGFAIPSNEVTRIVNQLETNGEVIRPYLGIRNYSLSAINEESRVNVLKLDPEMTDGVVVASVEPGSAAEQAGVQRFDVITAINGEEVTDQNNLRQLLFQHEVGDTIELTVLREGQETKLQLTLQAQPMQAAPMIDFSDYQEAVPGEESAEDEIAG